MCNLVLRHTNGNGIKTAADRFAYQIGFIHNYRKSTGKKCVYQLFCLWRNFLYKSGNVRFVRYMHNQRIVTWSALRLIDIFNSLVIERIRTQAVNGFGRKRHKSAVGNNPARFFYILIIYCQQFGFHYSSPCDALSFSAVSAVISASISSSISPLRMDSNL